MIILLILTTILIIYYFWDSDISNVFENFSTISYYKCPHLGLGKNYKEVYDKHNINRIDNPEDSDIYVPCGYNNVENELRFLNKFNKKQKIYGINGCDNIVSKNGIWNLIEQKYGREKASTLMPETYILYKPQDIEILKQKFNPNSIYLLKKNIQRKLGIELTQDLKMILDNQNSSFKVVQNYVDDLYLIGKRKVNLRLYFLIMCKNGKVKSFLHRQGKCIYTNLDIDSKEDYLHKEKHLTSLNLNTEVYDTRPESLEDLEKHLGKDKFLLLMNNIVINLKLVVLAVQGSLCRLNKFKDNTCFQLFGIDYIFDNKMTPFLLEMNKGPDMSIKSQNDPITKQKVLEDVFIETGIVKDKGRSLFFRL